MQKGDEVYYRITGGCDIEEIILTLEIVEILDKPDKNGFYLVLKDVDTDSDSVEYRLGREDYIVAPTSKNYLKKAIARGDIYVFNYIRGATEWFRMTPKDNRILLTSLETGSVWDGISYLINSISRQEFIDEMMEMNDCVVESIEFYGNVNITEMLKTTEKLDWISKHRSENDSIPHSKKKEKSGLDGYSRYPERIPEPSLLDDLEDY